MTTPHPGTREYRNEVVRLADLTVLEYMIQNVRFESCQIIGPAVLLVLDNVSFNGCSFDAPGPDALFWPLPASRQRISGAVGLLNVEFFSCRLSAVGLAINEQDYEALAAGLNTPPE